MTCLLQQIYRPRSLRHVSPQASNRNPNMYAIMYITSGTPANNVSHLDHLREISVNKTFSVHLLKRARIRRRSAIGPSGEENPARRANHWICYGDLLSSSIHLNVFIPVCKPNLLVNPVSGPLRLSCLTGLIDPSVAIRPTMAEACRG